MKVSCAAGSVSSDGVSLLRSLAEVECANGEALLGEYLCFGVLVDFVGFDMVSKTVSLSTFSSEDNSFVDWVSCIAKRLFTLQRIQHIRAISAFIFMKPLLFS
jgi:hypothetical protein